MTITLTAEHERIIQAHLATGEFSSVEEVLDAALCPTKPLRSDVTAEDGIAKAQAAAARIRELRQGVKLDRQEGVSLRDYAHLGHRY